MCRRRTSDSKVARRRNNAAAEMMLPKSVDKDPSRQGVVGVSDPRRESGSATSGFCIRNFLRKNRWEPGRYLLARIAQLAAIENERFRSDRHVAQTHRRRNRLWLLVIKFLQCTS